MAKPDADQRPDNPETQTENQRVPKQDGKAPRPATEPPGAGASTRSPKTQTDPGSGEPNPAKAR